MNYELDNIYCTNCYEEIKDIPDRSVDLIITDPPYDVSVDHGAGAFGVKKKIHFGQFVGISNGIDLTILDEFVRVLKQINVYIWASRKQMPDLLKYFVTDKGCYFNLITWHKQNAVPTCNNKYMPDTEYCLYFRGKGVPIYGTVETKKTYYVQGTNVSDKAKFSHPTIKPLNIIQNLVFNSTSGGGIVFDPFAGSGTTLVAAKNLNRHYLGFEIDPKWHKVAIDRLNNIQANGQITIFTE